MLILPRHQNNCTNGSSFNSLESYFSEDIHVDTFLVHSGIVIVNEHQLLCDAHHTVLEQHRAGEL